MNTKLSLTLLTFYYLFRLLLTRVPTIFYYGQHLARGVASVPGVQQDRQPSCQHSGISGLSDNCKTVGARPGASVQTAAASNEVDYSVVWASILQATGRTGRLLTNTFVQISCCRPVTKCGQSEVSPRGEGDTLVGLSYILLPTQGYLGFIRMRSTAAQHSCTAKQNFLL